MNNEEQKSIEMSVRIMTECFIAAMKEFDVDNKTIELILLEVPIRMKLITGLWEKGCQSDSPTHC